MRSETPRALVGTKILSGKAIFAACLIFLHRLSYKEAVLVTEVELVDVSVASLVGTQGTVEDDSRLDVAVGTCEIWRKK